MKNTKICFILTICLIFTLFTACNGGDPADTADLPVSSDIAQITEVPSDYSVGLEYIPIDGNAYAVSGIGGTLPKPEEVTTAND